MWWDGGTTHFAAPYAANERSDACPTSFLNWLLPRVLSAKLSKLRRCGAIGEDDDALVPDRLPSHDLAARGVRSVSSYAAAMSPSRV